MCLPAGGHMGAAPTKITRIPKPLNALTPLLVIVRKTPMAAPNKDSFEGSLKKLEEIVEKLEEADLPLDKSLKLFEEGIKEARFCEKKLTEAEGKVEKLIQENGGLKKVEFES
jgi:exodeoxyribonuclease VII small subunit